MRKYLFLFICILVLLPSKNYADNSLVIAIDGAFYKNDNQSLRWEFYYSFPDYTLNYIQENNIFRGSAKLDIQFFSNDMLYQSDSWIVNHNIKSLSDTNIISLYGIKNFILAPGQYKVKFKITDVNDTSKTSQTEFSLVAPNFNKNNINIGGIMLASFVVNADSSDVKYNDMFLRFDKYLFPNPSLEIYGTTTRIIAYAEIYNALTYAKDGFNITYSINDAVNSKIWSKTKSEDAIDNFMTEYVDVSFDSLHTGAYYLNIKITYPKDKPIDSTSISKKIFVVNPILKPLTKKYFTENQLFEKSIFNAMQPDEIDKQIQMVRIISNPQEIGQIDMLKENDAKKRYLFKFWLERDPDTTTAINERYQKFITYVDYATNYFSYKGGDGWKTDRGKVILRYGIPTERKQYAEDMSNRPYEEWFYENVQGGVYFYFVDNSYSGNFILVHSTAKNEPINTNWYNDYVIPLGDSKIGTEKGILPNVPNK